MRTTMCLRLSNPAGIYTQQLCENGLGQY
jgi:hypothetical protein